MARARTLPDNCRIIEHIDDGWTYQRIADTYGTSREAVSAMIARHRLALPKAGRHRAFIPWTIAPEHRGRAEARKLRLYSRRMQGEVLERHENVAVDNWLHQMDTAAGFPCVLAYSRDGGWHYVERKPEDGNGIVRAPVTVGRR